MNVGKLKNFGKYGVAITNISYPFDKNEIDEIRQLLLTELVVTFPKINYSEKQLWELGNCIGDVQTWGRKAGEITPGWTGYTDDEGKTLYPGLDKVTGKKRKDENSFEGLVTGVSTILNWHCNELPSLTTPNYVILQGVTGTKGTLTQVCEMIDPFENENDESKEYMRKLDTLWGCVTDQKYFIMPTLKEGSLGGIGFNVGDVPYTSEHWLSGINSTEKEIEHFKKTGTDLKGHTQGDIDLDILEKPLITKLPNGKEGVHFSPAQTMDISNLNLKGNERLFDGKTLQPSPFNTNYRPSNSFLKLREHIIKEYIQEKYIYSHEWEDGDLFIMNQTVCIHRRANAQGGVKIPRLKLENRLLNRLELTI